MVAALRALLEEEGLEGVFERGGKHPFVVVVIGARTVKYHFPLTPSDRRSEVNCVCRLRKKVREARQCLLGL